MKVLVNNKEVKTGATTLSQLIEELALPMQGIAVAVDNRIVLRTEWTKCIADARRILGAEYIIGGTANTFEDVLQHYKAGADYIGCGPFRYTTTKKNLSPILGLEGYTAIIHRMQEKDIHLPIVAIGGITIADIPAVMQTGVSGIALSGTVLHADSPADEMKRIISLMENEK